MMVAIIVVCSVVGVLLGTRAELKVWLVTLGPLAAIMVLLAFFVFDPCAFHGGAGNWPWWSDHPAGAIICADNTVVHLPWASP